MHMAPMPPMLQAHESISHPHMACTASASATCAAVGGGRGGRVQPMNTPTGSNGKPYDCRLSTCHLMII